MKIIKIIFSISICVLLLFPFGEGWGGASVAQPCKTASGAAIGNQSAWQYPPTSVTLTHPVSAESLTANTFTGTPTGAHVYRVDLAPLIYSGSCASGTMNTTPGVGMGGNDRYFGVFVVGGTTPTYTVVYNYWANPWVTPSSEPLLVLNKRNNNSISPWSDAAATLNTVAKTLTKTGEPGGGASRGEYMIGMSGGALPIELLYFKAIIANENQVLCKWSTASEINNDYFTVERTQDGINYEFIINIPGAGNSNTILNYSIIDPAPYLGTSYYRLKQTDFDGQYTYSQLEPINLTSIEIINIYPNPSSEYFEFLIGSKEDGMINIEVIDILGRTILSKQEMTGKGITKNRLDVSAFASGNYLLRITNDNLEKTERQFLVK